jgi:hypothetical protein
MSIIRHLFLLLLVLSATVAIAQPYLGVGHAWSDDPAGVQLTRIVPRSPAMIGGLRSGDIIIAIDSDTLKAASDLGLLLDRHHPGKRVTFLIYRNGETELLPLILGNREDYTSIMRQGNRATFPDSITMIFPDLEPDHIEQLIEKTVGEFRLQPAYNNLRRAFQIELATYQGFHTLDATAAVLLEPRRIGAMGQQLLEVSGGRSGQTASPVMAGMFSCINAEASSDVSPSISNLHDLIELLQQANRAIELAFADLTTAETGALANWFDPLLESFITTFYLHWEDDLELVAGFESLIASTHRINYDALAQAAQLLAKLDNLTGLELLEQELRHDYASRQADEGTLLDTLVVVAEDADGNPQSARLIISDDSDQIHATTTALLLDLGGDDLYLNNAGGTPFSIANGDQHHFRQGRVGICIDFSGDDRYFCNGTASMGSGLAGAGLLLDLSGNDTYSGARLAQGSAFAGVGLLHDYSGEDTYLGQEAVQGAAFFGSGLLWDDNGDDEYSAALYAQGCGGARGCGMLLDLTGNDHYIASHKHPNGYGNEATWSGWSQGVGVGFRQLAAGGLGLLCDRAGDDEYIAGNFSQGCGYFFGFGLFYDGNGNDRVTGNRYCQAALAHQAASCFFDEEGNDSYFGQEATNQGGTWDVGVALFLDRSGDDRYHGGSLSQGGCAQNAMALFCDLAGEDSYSAGNASQGAGGGNSYNDGRGALSLGLFFDLGGAEDSYADSTRGNNRQFLTDDDNDPASGEGVFQDR